MTRYLLGLILALAACGGGGDDTRPPPYVPPGGGYAPPPPGGETVVHAEDDGRAFDVPRGAMVTFKLAGNSGTGYLWTPAPVDPNVLVQQGGHTTEVTSNAPGAPNADVYRFAANLPGTAVVQMDYRRPWGNAPPARSIRVTINVH